MPVRFVELIPANNVNVRREAVFSSVGRTRMIPSSTRSARSGVPAWRRTAHIYGQDYRLGYQAHCQVAEGQFGTCRLANNGLVGGTTCGRLARTGVTGGGVTSVRSVGATVGVKAPRRVWPRVWMERSFQLVSSRASRGGVLGAHWAMPCCVIPDPATAMRAR
eukprot:UN3677